jgi:hypothetical protein
MTDNDRNLPAFPRPSTDHGSYGSPGQDGMTLRDYFAAAAMAAIIAKIPFEEYPADWSPYEKTAIGAYDYADALLAARQEQTS